MLFTWIEGDIERVLWKILGMLISLQGVFVILSQLINNDRIVKAVAKMGLSNSVSSGVGMYSSDTASTKLYLYQHK